MHRNHLFGIGIVLAFLLGAAAMWGYLAQRSVIAGDAFLSDMFDDQFFQRSRSPFEEMDRIHERMNRAFGSHSSFPDFDRWVDNHYGDFPLADIRSEENRDYLFYVLDIGGKDVVNIQVKTAEGYVSITADLKASSQYMSSSTKIDQRFPIPANVDPESVHIEQSDDEIRVRFTKIR